MKTISTRRQDCRLCSGTALINVLPINASPIADAFVPASRLGDQQPLIPLDLYQCQSCGHVQNLDVVDPELLFRDYIFTTSSSAGLITHFRSYADDMVGNLGLKPGDLVVEIGSNDGTLLGFFRDAGLKVLGIDPARDIARRASDAGIPTLPDYFDSALARNIRQQQGPAKLVVANNVYAHADRLDDITDGIASLLDDDGVFVFEVSYLLDIIDKFVFDTVYHEHLSYHSISPFVRFFRAHGLHLFDVLPIPTKGGSIRGFVQKAGGGRAEQPIVAEMMRNEEARGLHRPEIFREYGRQIEQRKHSLLDCLDSARKRGQRVVGYGASTTVTTLMYHFEVTDRLEYLIDDNPAKHGLYSPGCHLEVKPSTVLLQDRPDIVVILAWQYATPIMTRNAAYLEAGGCFVVPLPDLRVIDASSS
jgi:SAM-dependent methyltransferase